VSADLAARLAGVPALVVLAAYFLVGMALVTSGLAAADALGAHLARRVTARRCARGDHRPHGWQVETRHRDGARTRWVWACRCRCGALVDEQAA
jgi:uncharacterized protein (DUF58 family)